MLSTNIHVYAHTEAQYTHTHTLTTYFYQVITTPINAPSGWSSYAPYNINFEHQLMKHQWKLPLKS